MKKRMTTEPTAATKVSDPACTALMPKPSWNISGSRKATELRPISVQAAAGEERDAEGADAPGA